MPTSQQVRSESVPTAPASTPAPTDAHHYEKEHVHDVYNQIAPHFSATRHKPWPRVEQFLLSLKEYSTLIDLGCGNGKYLRASHNLHLFALGTDRCAPLVNLASAAAPNSDVAVADILSLPYRQESFDAALNIAVIHHLCTTSRRISALRETLRILRPGGRALIYVWALERPESSNPKKRGTISRRFQTQDVFVPWHLRTRKEGARSDKVLGDWQDVHHRFYHVYKQGELEDELSQVPSARLVQSYYDHQNWCALVEKA